MQIVSNVNGPVTINLWTCKTGLGTVHCQAAFFYFVSSEKIFVCECCTTFLLTMCSSPTSLGRSHGQKFPVTGCRWYSWTFCTNLMYYPARFNLHILSSFPNYYSLFRYPCILVRRMILCNRWTTMSSSIWCWITQMGSTYYLFSIEGV